MIAPVVRVVPLMRVLLVVGTVLVFAAGTQLYVLSSHTDRYFAWTIANPLTAATIGAFYYGAVLIAGLSAVQRRWDLARVGVPGILVFLWMTIAASLAHLSQLHLHATGAPPRLAALAWLVIYVADPVLLLVAYALQLSSRGTDPPRAAPTPGWYRWSCAAVGAPVLVVGVLLYALPGQLGTRWAWTLTPIAAQTLAAWLTALAVLLGSSALEGDAVRCRPASAGMAVLALLQVVALLRYPDKAHGAAAVAWIALLVAVGVLGGYGLLGAGRLRESDAQRAPESAAQTAAAVVVDIVDPGRPDAHHCLTAYFAELDHRFDAGFDPELSISAAEEELRPPAGLLLVASLHGAPIGCGALKLHGSEPAELKRMWVDGSARGLGLGRRILTELEAHAVAHGARAIRLETNNSLVEAVGLYRSAGYVEVAPFNDEPYADHWFEKRIVATQGEP